MRRAGAIMSLPEELVRPPDQRQIGISAPTATYRTIIACFDKIRETAKTGNFTGDRASIPGGLLR